MSRNKRRAAARQTLSTSDQSWTELVEAVREWSRAALAVLEAVEMPEDVLRPPAEGERQQPA